MCGHNSIMAGNDKKVLPLHHQRLVLPDSSGSGNPMSSFTGNKKPGGLDRRPEKSDRTLPLWDMSEFRRVQRRDSLLPC
jgi:hypothetical protein